MTKSLWIKTRSRKTVILTIVAFAGTIFVFTNKPRLEDTKVEWTNSAERDLQTGEIFPHFSGGFQKNKTLILFWTTLFGQMHTWQDYYGEMFTNSRCSNTCEVTTDKERLLEADILLFSAYGVDGKSPIPPMRLPNQIWAFFSQESPPNADRTEYDLSQFNGLFNWTITYRIESDVTAFYGHYSPQNLSKEEISFKKALEKKKKLVAAVISNCMTSSKRERFIKALVKAGIPVDIYGKCGKNTCAPNQAPHKCQEILSQDYKFILSMENSICKDYVTEKLFLALQQPWVPIVYGGANYTRFAPPHSVVDASDMSPTDLATVIRALDADDDEYLKYFEWKRHLRSVHPYNWGCDICDKVAAAKAAADEHGAIPRKTVRNLYKFWVEESKCREVPWNFQDTMSLFGGLLNAFG